MSDIGSTALTLSQLDEFFSTVIYYYCDDGFGKVGGHRLKLYFKTLKSFLPVAFIQLIEITATYMSRWCTDKLEVLPLDIYVSTFFVPVSFLRKATVEVFLPSSRND